MAGRHRGTGRHQRALGGTRPTCRCDGAPGRAPIAWLPPVPWVRAVPPVGVDAVGGWQVWVPCYRAHGRVGRSAGSRACCGMAPSWMRPGTGAGLSGDPRHTWHPASPATCWLCHAAGGIMAQDAESLSCPGVHVCRCAYVCVCMRVHTSVCVGVCWHALCVRAARQVWAYACSWLSMPMYAHICTCAHTAGGGLHTCVWADTRVHSHTCAFLC